LVSRYKDRPEHAIATWPAGFYVLLNAVGSISALYLMSVFAEKLGWPEGLEKWDAGTLVMAVLTAGFSALLFFRTSLFKLRSVMPISR
jgi:hypothetical protein